MYYDFNVYCRELAPSTVSLTGDRAQGDDSKQCAYSMYKNRLFDNIVYDNVAYIWHNVDC